MRRFFFDAADRKGDRVFLSAGEARHIVKVLRLGPGAEVELLDGTGRVYPAAIVRVERGVELVLGQPLEQELEEGLDLLLVQGILKGDKMDMVVQKATELGVTRLLPVHTSRCQGRLSAAVKKQERWQRIALAACKQCMRPRTMEVCEPVALSAGLSCAGTEAVKILFWEEEKRVSLHDMEKQCASATCLALFLGPEGGITSEEVELARDLGWQPAGLGKRILRAETASLTAVALVQYLSGNM